MGPFQWSTSCQLMPFSTCSANIRCTHTFEVFWHLQSLCQADSLKEKVVFSSMTSWRERKMIMICWRERKMVMICWREKEVMESCWVERKTIFWKAKALYQLTNFPRRLYLLFVFFICLWRSGILRNLRGNVALSGRLGGSTSRIGGLFILSGLLFFQ